MAKEIKKYPIEEAIKLTKDNSKTKFDATVELHINLRLDKSQNVRYTTELPKGTGKTKKVAVMASKSVKNADLQLSEADLKKIEKGDIKPKVDFDVLVAEPSYMAKIAQVARVLGPAGVMPNPKTGTVTDDVEKAVKQIKGGKIEVKTEKSEPLIHTILGKVSFSETDLLENYNEVLNSLKQNKPTKAKIDWIRSIYISSSMGPSYQIELV